VQRYLGQAIEAKIPKAGRPHTPISQEKNMFQALLLDKGESFSATVKPVDESALPPGDVLVRVDYSTLNYKDGLAITNKGPVVRQWPMVAGIDGAGEVIESSHPAWKPGDAFIHNGWA